MCFDKISNIARKTAKKQNLPILYIDTKRQFDIMKTKTDEYYTDMREKILQNNNITDECFQELFNVFENNMIHRAFKLANSVTFLNEDEYPKEQIIEIFSKMKNLVSESLRRCNLNQRKIIQDIMLKDADPNNLRYFKYDKFISFEELINLVTKEDKLDLNR